MQSVGLPAGNVPEDLIETFCKNTLNILSISTRSLAQELAASPDCEAVGETLSSELYEDPLQVRETQQSHCTFTKCLLSFA